MSSVGLPTISATERWTELTPRPSPLAKRLLPAAFVATLVVFDIALIVGAFTLAYRLRFGSDETAALNPTAYLMTVVALGIIAPITLAWHGLYGAGRRTSWARQCYLVVSALSTALVVAVILSSLLSTGDLRFSRFWFGTGWIFAAAALGAWRATATAVYGRVEIALLPARRAVIVGANAVGLDLSRELSENREIIGFVDNGSDLPTEVDVPLVAPIAQLEGVVHAHSVDEIYIALPSDRREQIARIFDRGFRRPVEVKFVSDVAGLLPTRFEVDSVGGRHLIGFAPAARVTWAKRALDLVLGGALTLALLPVFLVIAILIKIDSPGPILFAQVRMGKDGRPFRMMKFRSMCRQADELVGLLASQNEAVGPMFKIRRDPRVTRVGVYIRRFSLDELPQLLNVLRGEMSLVGPRPPLPFEIERYEEWQLGRLRVRPGMTGLWQVSGRSDVPFQDMIRLDLHYVRNWSLGLDLEILVRTLPAVLSSRGAY